MPPHRFSARLGSNGTWTIIDGPPADGPIFWSGLTMEKARLVTDLLNGLARDRGGRQRGFGPIPARSRRTTASAAGLA